MTAIRLFTPSLLAIALASCAPRGQSSYDTPAPYGTPDGHADPYGSAATAPANPVYDTPAAYEETTDYPAQPPYSDSPATSARPAAHGAAIIHTVVPGDTLSGISAKYRIPAASIQQANRMTNDIVVLGRKMVIPPQ